MPTYLADTLFARNLELEVFELEDLATNSRASIRAEAH